MSQRAAGDRGHGMAPRSEPGGTPGKRTLTSELEAGGTPGKRTRTSELDAAAHAQTPGPVVFSVPQFTPGSGGAVTAGPAAPDDDRYGITSGEYRSTAVVQVSGGTNAQAAQWDVGYLQTVFSDRKTAYYIGSPQQTRHTSAVPSNTRDGAWYSSPPWYDSTHGLAMRPFTATQTSETVTLYDRPNVAFPWDTYDRLGKLDRTDGRTQFTSWLVARLRAAPNTIQFLTWETWEVDWSTTTNYARSGQKTVASIAGATTNTGSGAGQGARTPNLTGDVAGDIFRASRSAGPPATGPGRAAPEQT